MELYRYPRLYEALRQPFPVYVELSRILIDRYLGNRLDGALDPACGPGTWLLPLARDGIRVAGNDLSLEMVRFARTRLDEFGASLTCADMCELPFRSGSFDLVFELSGSTCQLTVEGAVERFLASSARCLRDDGLLLVLVHFAESREGMSFPHLVWRSEPIPLPGGGEAGIAYELLGRDGTGELETIRRSVWTRDAPGIPDRFVDIYPFRMLTQAVLERALSRTQDLDLLCAFTTDEPPLSVAFDDLHGERLLAFRRRARPRPGARPVR